MKATQRDDDDARSCLQKKNLKENKYLIWRVLYEDGDEEHVGEWQGFFWGGQDGPCRTRGL